MELTPSNIPGTPQEWQHMPSSWTITSPALWEQITSGDLWINDYASYGAYQLMNTNLEKADEVAARLESATTQEEKLEILLTAFNESKELNILNPPLDVVTQEQNPLDFIQNEIPNRIWNPDKTRSNPDYDKRVLDYIHEYTGTLIAYDNISKKAIHNIPEDIRATLTSRESVELIDKEMQQLGINTSFISPNEDPTNKLHTLIDLATRNGITGIELAGIVRQTVNSIEQSQRQKLDSAVALDVNAMMNEAYTEQLGQSNDQSQGISR